MTIIDVKEMLQGWIDDINSGATTEMELPELDNYKTDKAKNAYIDGLEYATQSALDALKEVKA